MKIILLTLPIMLSVAGCTNANKYPDSYSKIAHEKPRANYSLLNTEQAKSLNIYPKLADAANSAQVTLPNANAGQAQRVAAGIGDVAAAVFLSPVTLFGKSPFDCTYCMRLNNLASRVNNSLIFPGIGYTKSWDYGDSLDFGIAVDRVLEALRPTLEASGCAPRFDNGSATDGPPLSDASTYFIGEYSCREPKAISENQSFLSSHSAHSEKLENFLADLKLLIVTRGDTHSSVIQASLISGCAMPLIKIESDKKFFGGNSWYKEKYGEGPKVTMQDYDQCRLGEVARETPMGWSTIETYVLAAPVSKIKLKITEGDRIRDIDSPLQPTVTIKKILTE